jgi:hypothetical protein
MVRATPVPPARPFYGGPLARKIPEAPIVASRPRSRIDRPRKMKKEEGEGRKKRRSFIMELRNCKLSKYNGRAPLARAGPGRAFCLRQRAPAGPNIELPAK